MRIPITLLTLTLAMGPVLRADISFTLTVGPPPMPVYEQPAAPEGGYLWEPGFWSWGDDGYFWVPGTWVLAPEPGLLWTPGYWGWERGFYTFHQGYWGTEVGFYGGINYGFGYGGSGFQGGRWEGRNYYYNRAVTNTGGRPADHVYNQAVTINRTHVSYNGGEGGVRATASRQDQAAAGGRHLQPTAEQAHHVQAAGQTRQLLASENHGRPPVAASGTAGNFSPGRTLPARAAGGPVNEQALKATPRTMPPAGAPARPEPAAPHGPAANPGIPGQPAPHAETRPAVHAPAASAPVRPEPPAPSRPEPRPERPQQTPPAASRPEPRPERTQQGPAGAPHPAAAPRGGPAGQRPEPERPEPGK